MSDNKYFTLITGKEIKQAPGTKICPEEAYSKLLSAKEVLELVQEEAEEYRKGVIAECEKLKDDAQKEGFSHGHDEWVTHIAKLEEEITKVRDEMLKLVMPIALKAAKKIVASEIASTPETILNITKQTLKSVAQHKKIVLYVNKDDFEYLDKHKSKIKELFETLDSLSLREREDVERGGLIVETEAGIINAQIKDRWRNLEAAFDSLGDKPRKGEK